MTDASQDDLLYFNGIDAATGQYALPPLSLEQFNRGILGRPTETEAQAMKNWRSMRDEPDFALMANHDPSSLADVGWGVVFAAGTDSAVIEALRPLLDWRKAQSGARYREYTGPAAVQPGESKAVWLVRQGAENYGPVDPKIVPYYLMLVGSPASIDYRFQYLLDVQYAVGRIYFDTPDEYARYARSVVDAEKRQIRLRREITFFGVANPDDPATNQSASQLISPLAQYFSDLKIENTAPWQVRQLLKEDASKARLAALMGGADTPALLFTASHGMRFNPHDPLQPERQGALLCQDWPGPRQWQKPIPEAFYFSGGDLAPDADLSGVIAFFFACYGAGTPQYDDFYNTALKERAAAAPAAFTARLPQKMLANPRGGALAVIGHVERAWSYSFTINKAPSINSFKSTLEKLICGVPIGHAFEDFNLRYADLSTALADQIRQNEWEPVDPRVLASTWTAQSDARNYIILGDPAVRAMPLEK